MNFLENLRNRLCCCNPRRLRAQQVAETARDMAMNVVNRVNDNPQQEENLVPVRYEHIVGYFATNPNQPLNQQANLPIPEDAQPANQPAAQPVEEDELPVERSTNQPANQPANQQENLPSPEDAQPVHRPAAQPVEEDELPVEQPVAQPVEKREELPAENNNVQQPQTARAAQPVAEEDHNFSLQAYEASGEAQRARQRIRAALQRSQALEQRLSQPFIDSNIPAQPFVNISNIPAQPFVNSRNIPAQPFVNSSNIPAFQPAAQQNNPNPIFTVRHTLGTPGYNLENAPAMSGTFSAGTHVFTGYDPFNNQRIEIDTDLNNEDRFVFRNIPKVEISRGFQHYTFDNARVVRVKRSDSIDKNDGQLHIDRNGNVRAKG